MGGACLAGHSDLPQMGDRHRLEQRDEGGAYAQQGLVGVDFLGRQQHESRLLERWRVCFEYSEFGDRHAEFPG